MSLIDLETRNFYDTTSRRLFIKETRWVTWRDRYEDNKE